MINAGSPSSPPFSRQGRRNNDTPQKSTGIYYSEVIIVGGGPAGSSCAWKLKRNGINCIVLDKCTFPRSKLCAGWITPQVLKDLEAGPDEYPHSLTHFRKLHFHLFGTRLGLKTRQYAIRRNEFDNWLIERAGTPVHRHEVKSIRKDGEEYIIDDAYRCRYLVGAGGTYCPVHRTFFSGENPRSENSLIVSMEEEFEYGCSDDRCHLWFFENKLPGYSWYVPKKNGIVNVGIGGVASALKKRGNTIREHWDLFVEKLANLSLVNGKAFEPRGYTYYLRQKRCSVQKESCHIVGDAAGLATKDMGEGIGPAVKSGILAANAIAHGTDYSLKSVPAYSLPGILWSR
jgi:flavin-dependent dehydrogenase